MGWQLTLMTSQAFRRLLCQVTARNYIFRVFVYVFYTNFDFRAAL